MMKCNLFVVAMECGRKAKFISSLQSIYICIYKYKDDLMQVKVLSQMYVFGKTTWKREQPSDESMVD